MVYGCSIASLGLDFWRATKQGYQCLLIHLFLDSRILLLFPLQFSLSFEVYAFIISIYWDFNGSLGESKIRCMCSIFHLYLEVPSFVFALRYMRLRVLCFPPSL